MMNIAVEKKTLSILQLLQKCQKMKQVPSNSSINDKGGSNPANIIFKKILDLHRKSHHFSIKKTAPTTITNIEEKIQSVSKQSLEEAFVAYKAAGEKAGKMPHPK